MLVKLKNLRSSQLLLLLLLADMFFLFFHILHVAPDEWLPYFSNDSFAVTEDLSMAEGFQYIKEFWIVLLLGFLALRRHKRELIGWSLLYGYFLFDDMLGLHERLGNFIAGLIGNRLDAILFASLELDDIGEAIGILSLGLVFALILIPIYLRLKPDARPVYRTLTWLLAALLFFGLGLDLFDRFFDSRLIHEALKLAEDGGEMLVMSVTCWYAYTLTDQTASPS
jgi:hypothetical protein